MTVSTDTARVDYEGDGAQTVFTVTFRFLDESHLKVILVESDGTEVVQIITTHYTVTGTGGDTGTVTMVTAPAADERLIIKRDVPFTQLTDLQTNGPLPANSLEDMSDQLTMAFQQVDERVNRSLHFKESSKLVDIEMDDLVPDSVLVAASDGLSVENGPTTTEIENAEANAQAAAASATDAAASAALAATVQEELVVATGLADAITTTHTSPVSLVDKTRVLVRAIFVNTAVAPTFAPDGLDPHTIVKEGRVALVAGDIADDQILSMIFNSANVEWELQNPSNPLDTDATMASAVDTLAPSQLAVKTFANLLRKNLIINGGFTINQEAYGTSDVLASGEYGHDQWKAGANGGDYSFTQLPSNTQITIESGKTLIQVIEDKNVVGGTYTLSWPGTAQARIGIDSDTPSGSYASSPITVTGQTAGTVMSVEFDDGTLGTVQLEPGSVATPFEYRFYDTELELCKWYFEKFAVQSTNGIIGNGYNNTTGVAFFTLYYTQKRVVPSIAISGGADFVITDSGGNNVTTTLTANETTVKTTRINANDSTAGLNLGEGSILRANNAGAFFDISARI